VKAGGQGRQTVLELQGCLEEVGQLLPGLGLVLDEHFPQRHVQLLPPPVYVSSAKLQKKTAEVAPGG
jgi:hypothetical protein